ncbi:MAG: viologen exporter family transport system permease protein [Gaiellaceae bacterium]|nr:viologen exporter family transport system permease protein [Gaiellaceae bacterium]
MSILRVQRAAFRDALANRRSFWVQVLVMAVNDVTWVIFWAMFFNAVGNVRGWDRDDVLMLFAILLTASGVALGLVGNARKLGQLVADGEIDAALALPLDPLSFLLARRVDTVLLGDLLTGPLLFIYASDRSLTSFALYAAGALCGSVVLIGFLVSISSLTLFVGGRGEQADLGFQAILIMASYPLDIFGGPTKVVLFTLIPAAFVTGLPASLLRDFDLGTALALTGSAAFFSLLGITLFRLGLRRYASGAVWTRA